MSLGEVNEQLEEAYTLYGSGYRTLDNAQESLGRAELLLNYAIDARMRLGVTTAFLVDSVVSMQELVGRRAGVIEEAAGATIGARENIKETVQPHQRATEKAEEATTVVHRVTDGSDNPRLQTLQAEADTFSARMQTTGQDITAAHNALTVLTRESIDGTFRIERINSLLGQLMVEATGLVEDSKQMLETTEATQGIVQTCKEDNRTSIAAATAVRRTIRDVQGSL